MLSRLHLTVLSEDGLVKGNKKSKNANPKPELPNVSAQHILAKYLQYRFFRHSVHHYPRDFVLFIPKWFI